jgi:adenine phosphoribosyltransferase
MNPSAIDLLRSGIRDVPDFPKPGIIFKDITPVLADPAMLRASIDALEDSMRGCRVDKIVAIDARGFIFAGALAVRLGVGLIPVRKKGKLPWRTEAVSYDLEYGSATVEIHRDAVKPGEAVWLIDDVLATGGTAQAASQLIHQLGGNLAGMSFLIELTMLGGRAHLPRNIPVQAVLVY